VDARRRRLEDLFNAHGAAVRAYALRRLGAGGSASADDVVSEVFAVAWRRIDVVPDGAELPWLLGCARRVVLHVQRRARRDAALVGQLEARATGAAVAASGDRVLAAALASLGERDREALLLIAWEGLSVSEAAVAVGCSRGAFAVRLHRARRRLSVALAHEASGVLEVAR
jgi:RNA polymerase sigma-70 factor (ECF subfamily)